MSKLDPNQKRLLELKRQLYGKEEKSRSAQKTGPDSAGPKLNTPSFSFSKTPANSAPKPTQSVDEAIYLKNDLLKIFYLSSAAILVQIILFFVIQNKLINIGL